MSDHGPASVLLQQLKDELKDQKLSDQGRQQSLEKLKIVGRDPRQARPIFESSSIQLLCEYGFDHGSNLASREALRCLSNAMLLDDSTRKTFLALDYAGRAADLMKIDDRDDEFLSCRVLFFATYTGKLDIAGLIDRHDLAKSIATNLIAATKRRDDTRPIATLAHQETVKLIPNLVYHHAEAAVHLSSAVSPLIRLLLSSPSALTPPTSLYINALLNLLPPASQSRVADLDSYEHFFPSSEPTRLTAHLTTLLSSALPQSATPETDTVISPLLSLLRTLHSIAQTASAPASEAIRLAVLPSASDRTLPLGKTTSLSSRLLNASTSPSAPNTRDLSSALLFEACNSDPRMLTDTIGYGFAIGILTRLGIEAPVPSSSNASSAQPADSQVPSDQSVSSAEAVNPITGQSLPAEFEARARAAAERARTTGEKDEPPMTEAEKEREAERLFVLFERLKATGVVDVKNPVELAMEQGKLAGEK